MSSRGSQPEGPSPDGLDPAVVEQLREPLAELQGTLDRLREPLAQLAASAGAPAATPADKVTRHIRRYLPLYALGTIWALMLVLVPTVTDRGGGTEGGRNVGAITDFGEGDGFEGIDGAEVDGLDPGSGGGSPGSATRAAARRATRRAGAAARAGGGGAPIGTAAHGTGVTRGGFECEQGVRQIPWSEYANPCVGTFEGPNGGKTYRGVDEKTIKFVVRQTADSGGPNAQTVDEVNKAAGRATRSEALEILKKYAVYLNKVYELYGRQVVFETWGSSVSNGTDEAQSKGKEGACADATEIAQSEQAFGVIGYDSSFNTSQPFADCVAEVAQRTGQGMVQPFAAPYFPEQWYAQRWHPYAYHIYTECEQIGEDVAEYIGKRLANRKAKWAGDPVYQQQNRVFGTYVPDNDGYQRCVNISETKLEREYGVKIKHRYDYQLDVSRFPDQAAQAVVQFQAEGVTTLINACDTISTTFLTQAADSQGWHPEWLIIGVALQDMDGNARQFSRNQVDGHLFGMSQRGSDLRVFGKEGEAYRTWKEAYPNEEPPRGFADVYFRAIHLFNMVQAAGPQLTPENIYAGLRSLPLAGGTGGAWGTWGYRDGDHAGVDDSREIYFTYGAQGFDGKEGTYLETYGGKRFAPGQWPAEEPPVYPDS